jgi:hypothetical protein
VDRATKAWRGSTISSVKRPGLLALCVSGLAAAALFVQTLTDRVVRRESPLTAGGDAALAPLPHLDEAPPPDGGELTGVARGTPRVDAAAEPASGREAVSTIEEITRTDHDPFTVTIELDVRLPDGSRPEQAFITFVPRDWTDARHQDARSDVRSIRWPGDDRREYLVWKAEDPRMGLQVDDDGVVADFLVLAEPCGDSPYDARAACRYHSGFVRYDPAVAMPMRVQLEEAAHVSIEVARPEELALDVEPWVQAARLDSATERDIAALLVSGSPWPEELLERDDFDSLSLRNEFERGEPVVVECLLPGRWRFVAGWGTQPPTAVQDVEIVLGSNHVALELGQPATVDYLPVRLISEGAEAVRPNSRDRQVAFTAVPPEIVRYGVELSSGGDGELWLPRSTLEALLWAAEDVRPVHFASVERQRSRMRLGYLSGPLDAAMTELVLTEVPAARVMVSAKHNGNAAFSLTVHAQLIDTTDENARLMRIAADRGLEFEHYQLEFSPDVRRVPLPVGLLHGRWRFSFHVPSAPLLDIAPVELELAGDPNELTVVVPDLFDVTVHAPSLGAGARIRLRPEGAPRGAAPGRPTKDNAALDAHQRAVFRGLPAGHYVLTHGASHAPETILVPCGEVLYEPRRSDAFEVRLAPLDDGGQGALARAGFQTGDLLLDFNGRGLREHDDLDALLQVIAENEATVRVRRGAHTLELRLGPMPDPGDPWATFDADFVPAWR